MIDAKTYFSLDDYDTRIVSMKLARASPKLAFIKYKSDFV